jgi:hypothetical protein
MYIFLSEFKKKWKLYAVNHSAVVIGNQILWTHVNHVYLILFVCAIV